jgi:hypothetical protein
MILKSVLTAGTDACCNLALIGGMRSFGVRGFLSTGAKRNCRRALLFLYFFNAVRREVLEQYAMGTLPSAALPNLGLHLLVCHRCQDTMAEMDAFVSAMCHACGMRRRCVGTEVKYPHDGKLCFSWRTRIGFAALVAW